MEQKINIDNLDDLQKQALVCMYYAMLPKTDAMFILGCMRRVIYGKI